MEDLIKAIEKLSEKTWVDYLLIIVPIAISLIAIIISVTTARRQNKIAMFELRYKALATIKRVLNFASVLYVTNNQRLIIESFNISFSTSISLEDQAKALVNVRMKLDDMEECISVISDLLNYSDREIIVRTFSMLNKIVNNAIVGRFDQQLIEDFRWACVFLNEITAKKLSKKIIGSNWCFNEFKSLSIANGTTLTKADIKKIKKQILINKKTEQN